MSGIKHTPGPWTVCLGSWSENGNAQYELEGITIIGRADAALIEAAPDLLEALMAYHEAYDENPHLGPRGSAVDRAFIKARAAIAKATGEQS